ncbi:MAG: hypothetical protein AAF065_08925 [Verrucomicrobiota bacterium]
MKTPKLITPLTFLIITLGLVQPVSARIGESRAELEGRLLRSGGIVYRSEDVRALRRNAGPYLSYLQYLGGAAEVRVYFKTDNGRQPTQSEIEDSKTRPPGWDVHVVYVNGKSALELYERSKGMSQYESNALLGLLSDGAYWKKPEKPAPDDEEEPPPSIFGFDFVRSDETVRAKRLGGSKLMVFSRELDELIARQHTNSLVEKAPASVFGF